MFYIVNMNQNGTPGNVETVASSIEFARKRAATIIATRAAAKFAPRPVGITDETGTIVEIVQ